MTPEQLREVKIDRCVNCGYLQAEHSPKDGACPCYDMMESYFHPTYKWKVSGKPDSEMDERDNRIAELEAAHAAALEEIERLKGERDAAFAMSKCECESTECCANLVKAQERADFDAHQLAVMTEMAGANHAAWRQAERRAERLQAKVDALMLEYCPDEMTPEQVEEWTRHQMAVAFDRAEKGE